MKIIKKKRNKKEIILVLASGFLIPNKSTRDEYMAYFGRVKIIFFTIVSNNSAKHLQPTVD